MGLRLLDYEDSGFVLIVVYQLGCCVMVESVASPKPGSSTKIENLQTVAVLD
jgi:hypothetical protein